MAILSRPVNQHKHGPLPCAHIAQRTSGMCTGTYRTREPVEAAVALWLQRYATELELLFSTLPLRLPCRDGQMSTCTP